MRILLVSNYQPPHMGGIEFAAESLMACWKSDGHEVTWLSTDIPKGARPRSEGNERMPAVNWLEDRFQINSPLVMPWHWPAIREMVRAHDVVNTHSLAPGVSHLAASAAIRLAKPLVATQHVAVIPLGSSILTAMQHRFLIRAARRISRHGGRLTFVGQAVRDWFVSEGSIAPEVVDMTPAGIDHNVYHFVPAEERSALRKKWLLQPDRLQVLFVGRFFDKKGLPLLREVARQRPRIQFTLVGGGPLDPSAWNLPNVRVISFVSNDELRELYGAHDLFLMPSYGEGWPAVVPQAMACGLRCMISEECFAGYAQDPSRFHVVPRRADDITAALDDIAASRLENEADRAALAHFASTQWDWMRTARIYTEIFRRISAPRR